MQKTTSTRSKNCFSEKFYNKPGQDRSHLLRPILSSLIQYKDQEVQTDNFKIPVVPGSNLGLGALNCNNKFYNNLWPSLTNF